MPLSEAARKALMRICVTRSPHGQGPAASAFNWENDDPAIQELKAAGFVYQPEEGELGPFGTMWQLTDAGKRAWIYLT